MHLEWTFKSRRITGIEALLDTYGAKEFDSPTRSTIPLLEYWRNPAPRLQELSEALGFSLPSRVQLNFEYTVSPPRGRGKASHTDLMIVSPEIAIAIEAKWTESRYEKVRDWLGNKSIGHPTYSLCLGSCLGVVGVP